VLATAALLALTQLTLAQGMSGSTGAVASIPGSVVRGHEQGPGLISILTDPTFANSNLDSKWRTARPSESGAPPRQTTRK
jgi:hypothetical protein